MSLLICRETGDSADISTFSYYIREMEYSTFETWLHFKALLLLGKNRTHSPGI